MKTSESNPFLNVRYKEHRLVTAILTHMDDILVMGVDEYRIKKEKKVWNEQF